jgi:hypothetical protein
VAPWGGSQGGHAALWVDRLAGLYAPEFEVPATVAIIPPADLSGEGSVAMASLIPGTANFAAYLVAAMRWYGNPASMAGVLTDTEPSHFATQVPRTMDTKCGDGGAFDDLMSLDQLFEPAFLAELADEGIDGLTPWSCYFRENSLTTTSWPRVGDGAVMFILSEKDELENIPVERAAFSRLCQDQGYRMQFLECEGARHAQGGAWSLPEQRAWLMDRLAGTPMDESKVCQLSAPVRCSAQPQE